ncbi:MAG: NAD-binding protein [Solirubrobacterales bacterium]|nr:NAD-binding protein [Solirubrobacterales bacterium]
MSATEPITRVAVVGGGFMGSGIAESAASAGLDVTVFEPQEAPLQRSRESLQRSVARAVSRDKLSRDAADDVIARVAYTTDMADLEGVQAVLEAVTEDPRVKGELFATLDERVPEARFLASNTSSIPIAELGSRTKRPDRVLGLHFFSPVPVMKLVEVVAALDTSTETLSSAEGLVGQLKKSPIRTKDRAGFVVNMLLVPYLMAAMRMYEDGFASLEDIDEGMRLGCGHPMGPLTLCDFIGLDVLLAVCESLYDEFKRPEFAPPPLLKRMVVAGHLGRKAGQGFYDYQ